MEEITFRRIGQINVDLAMLSPQGAGLLRTGKVRMPARKLPAEELGAYGARMAACLRLAKAPCVTVRTKGRARLAATRLDVDAAVGYYGGYIGHFAAEKVECPVMLHFGKLDDHIPPSVAESAQAANPAIEVYWYEAGHAFNRDVDPHAYVPEAAKLARERSLAFLKRNLGQAG